MELLDTDDPVSEDPNDVGKWQDFVEKFVGVGAGSEEVSKEVIEHMSQKPVFLPRLVAP